MANYSVKSVDEYISQTPEIARAHLREIRYDQKVPTALLKKIAKAQLGRQQSKIT